jgi:GTP-binding protein
VIDMSGSTGRDPIVDYQKINHELAVYDPALLKRPQIIVASKMDLPQAAENLKKFKEKLQQPNSVKIIGISAVTHQGLAKLLEVTAELVEKTPAFLRTTKLKTTNQLNVKYQAQQPAFTVTRDANAVWILSGEKLERLFEMTNFEHDESTMRFARQLKSLGVDDELRKRGAKNGDLVKIKDFTFEFVD